MNKLKRRFLIFLINKWYNYIVKKDSNGEVTFLNYGYQDGQALPLKAEDEKNRYCIQLYHKVISEVELMDKKVLEVGCGKGGGASYIARYMSPKIIVGLDKSKQEIGFNKKYYSENNLDFKQGDALDIPFSDESFDILINVESSHVYPDFDTFLKEVKRVLRTDGYFLFTDFRRKDLFESFFNSIENSGLKMINKEDITENVAAALDLDNERRIILVNELLPKIFHKWGMQFSGARGSELYESFNNGNRKYFYFVLQKA